MQQSYVSALIAMMVSGNQKQLSRDVAPPHCHAGFWCVLQVWSITYHSWLTFVLLLWACLIWILRARYRACRS